MPKTREQYKEIKDERRECIIRSCTSLFSYHDYQSVSVDAITKASNCSHGLFYHYFNDIEDLFHTLMEEIIIPYIHEVLPQCKDDKPAIESLNYFFNEVVNGIKDKNTDIACMYFLLLNLHLQKNDLPKPKRMLNNMPHKEKRIYTVIKELIEKGQTEGNIIDEEPDKLTVAVLSMIDGLAFNRINLGYHKFICPSGDTLTKMLIKKGE